MEGHQTWRCANLAWRELWKATAETTVAAAVSWNKHEEYALASLLFAINDPRHVAMFQRRKEEQVTPARQPNSS